MNLVQMPVQGTQNLRGINPVSALLQAILGSRQLFAEPYDVHAAQRVPGLARSLLAPMRSPILRQPIGDGCPLPDDLREFGPKDIPFAHGGELAQQPAQLGVNSFPPTLADRIAQNGKCYLETPDRHPQLVNLGRPFEPGPAPSPQVFDPLQDNCEQQLRRCTGRLDHREASLELSIDARAQRRW